jgi:soluble lytic murein transglycosylase-like protein
MDVVTRIGGYQSAVLMILVSIIPTTSHAQRFCGVARWQSDIAEAAQRFLIPPSWIAAVILVESAGCARIDDRPVTSIAGAVGLMQLMPATWDRLSRELALGTHADEPRENILAGTAYLRELYERFGSPGFLAAYHAGPARYQDYMDGKATLPQSTWEYLARVRRMAASSASRAQLESPGRDMRFSATTIRNSHGRVTADSIASRPERGIGHVPFFIDHAEDMRNGSTP